MLNIDLIDQDDFCFCGKRLDGDTVILIEQGTMRYSKKDPTLLQFWPLWKLPRTEWPEPGNPDSITRKAMHVDCFRDQFDRAGKFFRAAPKRYECHTCTRDLRNIRHVFRCQIGEIDQDSFVPDKETRWLRAVICSFCAQVLFEKPEEPEGYNEVEDLPEKGQRFLI